MNPSFQNLPTAGLQLSPGRPTRITPPQWLNYKLITTTTSTETVPQGVYQVLAAVWGGSGAGVAAATAGGGGGGGFAMGIFDVVPGQVLPTITIGAASGTSSFGTFLIENFAILK